MALETFLGFGATDSTASINAKFTGLVPKGVLAGGVIVPVPSTLQVRVTAGSDDFVLLCCSGDGMTVREAADEYVLPVLPGIQNVIVVRAFYNEGQPAIAEVVSMSLAAYQADPNPGSLIRLAMVSPQAGANQVQTADIDMSYRDTIEAFQRSVVRGVVSQITDLPAVSGFPAIAEINFVGNDFVSGATISVSAGNVRATFTLVPAVSFALADSTVPGVSRVNPSQVTIVSLQEQQFTGVITVTTATAHDLNIDDQIRISNTGTLVNGTFAASVANNIWTVSNVIDPYNFQFVKVPASLSPISATGGNVINMAALAEVSVQLAPGVTSDLQVTEPIQLVGVADPTFNTIADISNLNNEQQFQFLQQGFPTGTSGGGEVQVQGIVLAPGSIPIGASSTVTATNFVTAFTMTDLSNLISASAIGSSVQLQVIAPGSLGSTYTLTKNEPGVSPTDAQIVVASFAGGSDPLPGTTPIDLKAGDLYVVLHGEEGALEIWGYNGTIFENLTSATTTTILDYHRRNLLTNELHLTDNQAAALVGTVGTPSATNPFVTAQDTSVLTSNLASALLGADNVPPSGTNQFLTQAHITGSRQSTAVPSGQDWVQLPAGERWVLGNTAGGFFQFFNVVFTNSLNGNPQEYTQTDFTPVTVEGIYYQLSPSPASGSPFQGGTPLDPSDPNIGSDPEGVYPIVNAVVFGNPIALYVKLSAVPDNGSCSVLYTAATTEKVRLPQDDVLAGPQRIVPAQLVDIENRVAELRFNYGIGPSATAVNFPADLFAAINAQGLTLKRPVGGGFMAANEDFSIDFATGAVTPGAGTDFSPVAFSAANVWTRYVLSVSRAGSVSVHHIATLMEQTTDQAFSADLNAVAYPTAGLTNGDWIFASVAVQSNSSNNGIQAVLVSSIELYPYQASNARDPGAPLICGDGTSSVGHFTGSDAVRRAMAQAPSGAEIVLLPGTYIGQFVVTTPNLTLVAQNGAVLTHASSEHSAAVTVSQLNPAIFNAANHPFSNGYQIQFAGSSLPAGVQANKSYYITNATTSTFQISSAYQGSEIAVSSFGSGVSAVSAKVCLNVEAEGFIADNLEFANCDIGMNVAAADCSILNPTFAASVARSYTGEVDLLVSYVQQKPNTTIVCTDGTSTTDVGDFNSANALTGAIAAASDGDVIILKGGTYNAASWSLNKATLLGQDNATITGNGGIAFTVVGSNNKFSGVNIINSSVGISVEGIKNTFDASVSFDDTVTTPINFPVTISEKHYNFHPLFCGSPAALSERVCTVTVGDGTSSWGDYVGINALGLALLMEPSGTTIRVGPGTYAPIHASFSNMIVVGCGPKCVIQAVGGTDDQCLYINGDGNHFSNLHLSASNNETYNFQTKGIRVSGSDNVFRFITFDVEQPTEIKPSRIFQVIGGRRNKFDVYTGAPTDRISMLVGDGIRSSGEFLSVIDALQYIPVYPRGETGAITNAAGSTCTFSDPSGVADFSNSASLNYVQALGRWINVTTPGSAGSFKVTAVSGQNLTLERFDGQSFVNATGLVWNTAAGVKIVVLPGTYAPFTITPGQNDVEIEAWGAGSDVIISGAGTGITVQGSRCRVKGFRIEGAGNPTDVGIEISGSDNVFESNVFATATSYKIDSTALRNKIYDGPFAFYRTAYTVGTANSRADFVGTTEAAVQAAVDAASADQHLKRVVLGAGTYTFSAPVSVPPGVTIEGVGYDTKINANGGTAFSLSGSGQKIGGIYFLDCSSITSGPATLVLLLGNWVPSGSTNPGVTGTFINITY